MKLNKKLILVDADGVLLDWVYSFTTWMKRHGYPEVMVEAYDMSIVYNMPKDDIQRLIRIFNESAAIYNIPPLRDAIKYLKKLHEEHGYVFHVISSLSTDWNAQHLRTKNLQNLFGSTMFEKFVYLDTGASKEVALEPYRDSGCYFVEDKIENAMYGNSIGLESVVMLHDFNYKEAFENCLTAADNWKGIYKIITRD
jgi:hypothetical protein